MNQKIIDNYNSIITENDTVIHLGDLSATVKPHLNEFKTILQSLNGQKILLRGNHDHQENQFYLDNGFETVGDYLIFGDYFFSHYPLFADSKYCTPQEKSFIDIFNKTKCTKIIHGHTHNNVKSWPDDLFRINACVEVNDFKPLKLFF
jgi:calcineurin-like phosphoesterase family protein